jgi:hypothetical protein
MITTSVIFVMGLVTVILSAVVATKFKGYSKDLDGHSRNLSRAISWQLVGEGIIGFGTLIFATAAHFGWLSSWPVEVQSGLRFIMFAATSATTIHLWRVVRKTGHDQ